VTYAAAARRRCLVQAQFKLVRVPHLFCASCRKGARFRFHFAPPDAAHLGVLSWAHVLACPRRELPTANRISRSIFIAYFSGSPRAGSQAGLFPQLLPMPHAGSFVQQAVAELVREHQNLAAVMRLVREHVREHAPSGGPRLRPTAAREFFNAAIRSGRKRVRQHAQALRGAFPVRGGSLLYGAAVRIQRRRTFQMRRGIFQPHKTAVVQMREDGGDRPAAAFLPGD